jgi:hypothetical protein
MLPNEKVMIQHEIWILEAPMLLNKFSMCKVDQIDLSHDFIEKLFERLNELVSLTGIKL